MARFYGEIIGSSPKPVTRMGRKEIFAHIRGWDLGVEVKMFVNENGDDEVVIRLTGGSNSPTGREVIFRDSEQKNNLLKIGREIRLVLSKPKVPHLSDKI